MVAKQLAERLKEGRFPVRPEARQDEQALQCCKPRQTVTDDLLKIGNEGLGPAHDLVQERQPDRALRLLVIRNWNDLGYQVLPRMRKQSPSLKVDGAVFAVQEHGVSVQAIHVNLKLGSCLSKLNDCDDSDRATETVLHGLEFACRVQHRPLLASLPPVSS